MSDCARFFHKNLYFCLERFNIRILDDEHDSVGEGEDETIVHGEIEVGFVELWISFSEE
jgi:hypothetical protein